MLTTMVVYRGETFAERFSRALDYAGVPSGRQRRMIVARMFKVSGEAVRKWLAGESIPNTKRIQKMAEKLGVRGEWLLTGQGPMLASAAAEEADSSYSAVDSRQLRLLSSFKELTESQQDEVLREVEEIKQRNEAIFEELSIKKRAKVEETKQRNGAILEELSRKQRAEKEAKV
jgi:hypothetical protein